MQISETNVIDWSSLIAEQASSGLSKAAFCRERGVKAPHFYYYHSLLKQRNQTLLLNRQEEKPHSLLVPIEIKKVENNQLGDIPIRFLLKNGMECVLPSALDIKLIKGIIEVLVTC